MTTRMPILAALALLTWAAAWPLAARAQPAGAQPSAVDMVRQAAQADKRGLVEKNMRLAPDEAKRFWPIYDEHQRRLERIVQRQNRAILDYINAEDSMTDANAKRLVREILDTDAEEQRLRERTVGALLKVLPARKAARYLQIENKIRTINRFDVAERIPLVR